MGAVVHRVSPRWVSRMVSLRSVEIWRRDGRDSSDPKTEWFGISSSLTDRGINGNTPSNSGACTLDRVIRSKDSSSRLRIDKAIDTTSLSLLRKRQSPGGVGEVEQLTEVSVFHHQHSKLRVVSS